MAKKKRERIAKVAKAGRRAPPAAQGPHRTTPEDRARGRWLASLGLKFFPKFLTGGQTPAKLA